MSEWISIDDRLPEEFITCLVFCDGFFEVAEYNKHFKTWINVLYSEITNIDNVTHWMPLPEPPEQS